MLDYRRFFTPDELAFLCTTNTPSASLSLVHANHNDIDSRSKGIHRIPKMKPRVQFIGWQQDGHPARKTCKGIWCKVANPGLPRKMAIKMCVYVCVCVVCVCVCVYCL